MGNEFAKSTRARCYILGEWVEQEVGKGLEELLGIECSSDFGKLEYVLMAEVYEGKIWS